MATTDKVAVFIDGGYVRAILKDYYHEQRIDFLKLSEELCQGCERFRSYYYMCPPYQSQTPSQEERQYKADYDKFIESLRRLPRFIIRQGYLQKIRPPQCRSCGLSQNPVCINCKTTLPYRKFQQKGVDVNLSIDLTQISASQKIDKAVILSADGDFKPAIEQAKENMVIVSWAFFKQQRSWILDSVCDERVEITPTLIEKIKLP